MDKLFLEEVIDRYRHPLHHGHRKGQKFCAQNLSCGDDITLYLEIDDDIVKSAKFDGEICSIANYGAELLCDQIIGRNIADAAKISSRELLGKSSGGLLENPVRLKCFELAQMALISDRVKHPIKG
ncbi:iron-sulfur cluster assembly scaffold protein [Candidatus Saccharibacteria bacterium]|nr:iron-sulfur cluster assembly scaffold protein [Candidatus Saccharibacteria bacterium]MCL1962953.1 iron-sulfur cluster assembly scaffold protein [Candidatus Saccharibacteria bacterium]